jgi:hypothetical protein
VPRQVHVLTRRCSKFGLAFFCLMRWHLLSIISGLGTSFTACWLEHPMPLGTCWAPAHQIFPLTIGDSPVSGINRLEPSYISQTTPPESNVFS